MKRDRYLTATGAAIAALLLLMALLLNAHHYLPFLSDDALISLRYARRLIDGHGLTWNQGRPVEGYSNLLWVLASALLGGLGMDLIDAVRWLGVAGMGGSVLVLLYAYRRYTGGGGLLPLAGAAMLSLAAPIAVWTVGGLEQPFVALFLALGVWLAHRAVDGDESGPRGFILAGIPLGLLALTRPDGMLFTAAIALALLVIFRFNRRGFAAAVCLAAVPAACYLGQLAFRLGYYGEWVPNTALVKVGFSAGRLIMGVKYVIRGSLPLLPVIIPIAIFLPGAMRDPAARRRIIITLIPAVLWLLYVMAIGGDIFPAGRHLVPFIILLGFLLSECGVHLATRETGAAMLHGVAIGALALLAICGLIDSKSRKAIDERWEWCGRAIGLMLKRSTGKPQPLLAVDAAGCLPYWSELPSVDMLGLNDYYLPRHRPPDFGSGMLGHELGDGRYVLSRNPDLIIFGGPPGDDTAGFRSGREMQAEPVFQRDYSLAIIHADDPEYPCDAHIWVRRNGRMGIDSTLDRISIPAQLLTGIVRVDSSGGFYTVVTRGNTVEARNLALPAGRWRITIPGADAPGAFYAYVGRSNNYGDHTWAGNMIDVPKYAGAYDIVLASGDGRPVVVRSVELRRVPVVAGE
ncbi:MAG: hypothetical protein JWQ98_722 [Chlorobi bacterium]|nr:hypothetical protein [Chlorobiota bacterium]